MLLVPKSLVYLCFNATTWAMLTGEDLFAMTILVFGGCESQAPLLHGGEPAYLGVSTSPDLLLSGPPVLPCSNVTLQ